MSRVRSRVKKPPRKTKLGVIQPNNAAQREDDQKVLFSFELAQRTWKCPSECQKEELKQIFSLFEKVSQRTWDQVIASGGKSGNKAGLGYTPIGDSCPCPKPSGLLQDDHISEMRANDKIRIYGVRRRSVYFVIAYDRDHELPS